MLVKKNDEVKLLAKLIGFKRIPPDIETFIKSPKYLGDYFGDSIFPIWVKALKELYPDPIRTSSTFVVLKGAIGIGKSTMSKICILYDLYKLLCIKNPYIFFKFDRTSNFTFRLFNINLEKAGIVFVNTLNEIIYEAPCFTSLMDNDTGDFKIPVKILPASRPDQILSENLVSAVLSELNFFRPHVAEEILNKVISRMESRFQLGFGYINHIIIDSSDTYEDSIVENFIKESPYRNQLKIFRYTIWEAKSHLNIYFKKKNPKTNKTYFEVYVGGGGIDPFIIESEEQKEKLNLDPELIIKVPEELREVFETDLQTALQEKAGISITRGNQFISDEKVLKESMTLPVNYDEEIIVSFYGNDRIFPLVYPKINKLLDPTKPLYVRIDLGVSYDYTGFAIIQADKFEKLSEDSNLLLGYYKAPVIFRISRYEGEETPINKILDFILDLSKHYHLKVVSTDQYQSTQLRQELQQNGINAIVLSVDRDDSSYRLFKRLLLEGRLKLPNMKILYNEIMSLKDLGDSIDHPPEGFKDMTDALVGALQTCYDDYTEALEIPYRVERELSSRLLLKLAKDRVDKDLKNKIYQLTGGNIYGYRISNGKDIRK